MEVIQYVLVKQVRFVEQEDGMALLTHQLLDMLGNFVEDICGGGLRVDASAAP